jgi:stearoyl-CoA desaturase (delta-9 desaturase)
MKKPKHTAKRPHILLSLLRWFDSDASIDQISDADIKKVDWFRIIPFVILHLMCLGVIWVGWSWFAVLTAAGLYFIRMFAITGFYHRYFSHRAFNTNRFWQFIFAVIGNSSVQRGPLWWAAHHRHHHRYADTEKDIHSPARISLEPHRLANVTRKFPYQNAICQRLGEIS